VNLAVQISDPLGQSLFVVLPRHVINPHRGVDSHRSVDPHRGVLLQCEEGFQQQVFIHVMQQRRELQLGLSPSCCAHAVQSE